MTFLGDMRYPRVELVECSLFEGLKREPGTDAAREAAVPNV